jgi:hypothetical protein
VTKGNNEVVSNSPGDSKKELRPALTPLNVPKPEAPPQ